MSASHTFPRSLRGPSHKHGADLLGGNINREEGESLPVWALDGSGGRKNLRGQSSVQAETQTLVSFALTDQKSLF